jgi:hypothetical protein
MLTGVRRVVARLCRREAPYEHVDDGEDKLVMKTRPAT